MRDITRWAIIDAAAEPDTLTMLEQLDPPHVSLYAAPVSEEIGRLAPHLVEFNAEVDTWLRERETPWGLMLESRVEMRALRKHLRKYLHALIPGEEKPVFFRFYDPRNIWDLLSILSPWERHSFLGPIEAIATYWQGELRQENFSALREQFHSGSTSRRKVMKISQSQMDALALIFERRYVETLIAKMAACHTGGITASIPDAEEIFRWLKSQGIKDDRSVRGLFFLFHQRGYLTLASIPAAFKAVLSAQGEPGVFKAESLLIQALGSVPL
ncbi:hypothetical protein LG71_07990 [Pluralibacter gergoviae]|uniref:DUF4123 domain-containing protein n=1 Tax=Pluralibacter gergoviae TaxID=61647 RepID=UPI0004F5E865|nr:DUF4123 domain-containing protein [Pluralibacter gergoviae]AIQ99836.1 hypothetical protein LG71_07990 [Pluralibacter gergoviae]